MFVCSIRSHLTWAPPLTHYGTGSRIETLFMRCWSCRVSTGRRAANMHFLLCRFVRYFSIQITTRWRHARYRMQMPNDWTLAPTTNQATQTHQIVIATCSVSVCNGNLHSTETGNHRAYPVQITIDLKTAQTIQITQNVIGSVIGINVYVCVCVRAPMVFCASRLTIIHFTDLRSHKIHKYT